MKKKSLIICFVMLLFLLIIPSVISTELKIKTIPSAEVQVSIYDGESESAFTSRLDGGIGNSDSYGDVSYSFDISKEKFNVIVFVKEDGETVINQKFLDNPSSEMVYLEIPYKNISLIPTPGFENGVAIVEKIEEIINETEENETEILEGGDSRIVKTGFSIFGDDGFLSKKNFYYLGGFLFLIVIVGFVVAKIKHKINSTPREIQIKKLSELQQEQKEDLKDKKEEVQDYKQIIEDAERKIVEAQQDIKKIKNEEKIKDMRKKIEEDQRELEKLREGKE